jgi:hypothetical protein
MLAQTDILKQPSDHRATFLPHFSYKLLISASTAPPT